MNIQIHPATIEDYTIIQNLARFYVYDRTPYMGWECAENGMFECIDFKHYLIDPDKKSFLIKRNEELVGFVLIDQEQLLLDNRVDWNMGEFFVLAKFQNKGIGSKIIQRIFELFLGKWSIAVMPENKKALSF